MSIPVTTSVDEDLWRLRKIFDGVVILEEVKVEHYETLNGGKL